MVICVFLHITYSLFISRPTLTIFSANSRTFQVDGDFPLRPFFLLLLPGDVLAPRLLCALLFASIFFVRTWLCSRLRFTLRFLFSHTFCLCFTLGSFFCFTFGFSSAARCAASSASRFACSSAARIAASSASRVASSTTQLRLTYVRFAHFNLNILTFTATGIHAKCAPGFTLVCQTRWLRACRIAVLFT